MITSLAALIPLVSAFGIVTVSSQPEYSGRPLRVLPDGYVSIDGGEILDAQILANSSLTINGQLTHYDQGLFLQVGWPDQAGDWTTEGGHLLNSGHASFIVCPENWYGIAYAGVGPPITCSDPVEVLLAITDSTTASNTSSSVDVGSGYALATASNSSQLPRITTASYIPYTESTSSFTYSVQTFDAKSYISPSSSTNSQGILSQTQSINMGVSYGFSFGHAIWGLFL